MGLGLGRGQDDDDDQMLLALSKSRLADDATVKPESAAHAKAKAKAAALQPGKRFQPNDPNAVSAKKRAMSAAKPPLLSMAAAAGAGAAQAAAQTQAPQAAQVAAANSSPPLVRQPKASANAASLSDQKKYMDQCDIVKVFTGKTAKMDLYQSKRCTVSLEKKGLHEEANQLAEKLRVATSAHSLLPTEASKLGLDQIQARPAALPLY